MGDDVLGISLLGAFSITVGGHVIPDDAWRLRKAKTLIKLLALAPERRLHADRATELLWAGREEASARNNLHQAIFAARRALDSAGLEGRNRLELHEDVIALCPEHPVRIDVLAFEEAAASARVQRDPAAYRDALDAYEGELLPEDRYEEWTVSRRDAVHELRLALGIELAELQAPEHPAAAIDRLRSVLVDAPLHEPAHRALMRLYVGGGRRQEALAQFQELKLGLRREFEDEPDEVTRAIATTHEPTGGLDTHVEWAQQFYAEIEPSLTGGAYINFLSSEGEDRVQAAYGAESFARLRALKDRYDPTNLFHLNQNIPPS